MKYLSKTLVTTAVYYGLVTTEKAFKKEIKRIGIPYGEHPTWDAHKHGAITYICHSKRGNKVCIVAMIKHKKYSRKDYHGLLTHEAVHVWQEVAKKMGEAYPSDEFEAYSIQSLSRNLIDEWERLNKKKKK